MMFTPICNARASRISNALSILLVGLYYSGLADSANWPHWRGPQDSGGIAEGEYPVKWETNQLNWSAELPGKGCSTPVAWGGRIFLTAPINKRDGVLAYDQAGKLLWQCSFDEERPGQHRNGSGCNPSPVTDGRVVVAYFKSGGLAAVDLNGQVLWRTNLIQAFGPETLYWDQGTSPVLAGANVVIARMHHGDSWLAAFDKRTGEIRWKVARNYETPSEDDHSYSTPLLVQHNGQEKLLVWGAEHLTLHDISDGKLVWACGNFNPDRVPNCPAVASPVAAGEVAIIASGRADRGRPLLYGVQLGSGGQESTNHLWKREDTGTFVPTPALQNGRLYLLRDRGEIDCLQARTGETIWHAALPKSSANYYASPLVTRDKLYAVREDGVVFVASIQEKFEVLSENQMGERIVASPVPFRNGVLLRGDRHLFYVGGRQQ